MSVLADRDIADRFDEIFATGSADRERIRAAKYYLRLGDRFLILPDGTRYFGSEEEGAARSKPFSLAPGQTAMVSTMERISMPMNLSGIFGPITDLTDSGVLFFGGMLVDPGFGFDREGDRWVAEGEPLSFYVANIGSEPYPLAPGADIASIAFLELSKPYKDPEDFPERFRSSKSAVRAELFDPKRTDPPHRLLGLVQDIRSILQRVDRFEASTFQVVVFGVLVLAVTLFAAIVSIVVNSSQNVASEVKLDDVLITAVLVCTGVAAIALAFHLSVLSLAKILELRQARRRIRRAPSEPAG